LSKGILYPAITVGVLALLIAPTVWSGTTVLSNRSPQFGGAGPVPGNPFAGVPANVVRELERENAAARVRGQGLSNTKLERYLQANQGNAQFILATQNAMTAAPLIIDTGKPVMALGGFSGADPILTQQQLVSLVQNGTVRFFLLPSISSGNASSQRDGTNGPGRGGFGGQNGTLTQWVNMRCSPVPTSQWQAGTSSSTGVAGGGFGFAGGQQLFDCANSH
jgi:4-amino-4-deoxy-L-arabinose transferase-like glycosyltransferase